MFTLYSIEECNKHAMPQSFTFILTFFLTQETYYSKRLWQLHFFL